MQSFSNLTTRQKATAIIFILILLVVIWQVWGLFGESTTTAPSAPPAPSTAAKPATSPGTPEKPSVGTSATIAPPTAQESTPRPAQLITTPNMSPREMELMKLQQETETKYLNALNELQMLRINRDLAETNQAIMNARLQSVTAAKKIVDLLSPPSTPQVTPANYAQTLVAPTPVAPVKMVEESPYTAISVIQLQGRWTAVLGYKGTLYNVSKGDILPPDRSRVVSIDKSGVILEKDGIRRKISLVPVI